MGPWGSDLRFPSQSLGLRKVGPPTSLLGLHLRACHPGVQSSDRTLGRNSTPSHVDPRWEWTRGTRVRGGYVPVASGSVGPSERGDLTGFVDDRVPSPSVTSRHPKRLFSPLPVATTDTSSESSCLGGHSGLPGPTDRAPRVRRVNHNTGGDDTPGRTKRGSGGSSHDVPLGPTVH